MIINNSKTIAHLFEPEFSRNIKNKSISCEKINIKQIQIDDIYATGLVSNLTIIENLFIKNIYSDNDKIVSIDEPVFIIDIDKSLHNIYADSLSQFEYIKSLPKICKSSMEQDLEKDILNLKPFFIKKAIDEMDKHPSQMCNYSYRNNLDNRPEYRSGPIVKFIEELYSIKTFEIYKIWSCNILFKKVIFITDYDLILNSSIYENFNIDIPYYIKDIINDQEYTFGKLDSEFYERRIGLHFLKNKIKNTVLKQNPLLPEKIYVSRFKYNDDYFYKYFEKDRDRYRHGMQKEEDLVFDLKPFSDNLKYDEGMKAITGPMSTWSRKREEVRAINSLYESRFYHDEKSLEAMLQNRFGYEPIRLEELSIVEQLNLFYNATHIVSLSGSSMVNLIACKDNINFCEISPWEQSPEKFRMFAFQSELTKEKFTELYSNYYIIAYHKDKNTYIKKDNIVNLMWVDADSHEILNKLQGIKTI